jgi:RNA polymerase sigma-70 factor (ECF subfamily)
MDGELIERARTGDADSFDELARSRIDQVYATALGILGSPPDARDACQEALVAMWRGLPRLRDAAAFDGWLYRVTVNAAKMSLRRRRGVRELHLEPDMPSEAELVEPDPNDRPRIDFDVAFERLTVDQRALLLRHHLDGASIVELARQLEVPEGTVKSRLHKARAALALALDEVAR